VVTRMQRRVDARIAQVTDYLSRLQFEAVHGPCLEVSRKNALWCMTLRRPGLPDVLFDFGELLTLGQDGLPAQYSYQLRFCDRGAKQAWQYRLDFHGHQSKPRPEAHMHDYPTGGRSRSEHDYVRYKAAIGELVEAARSRAETCAGDAPKPPDDCVTWLKRVLLSE
jgi:hypothetical protein